MPSSHPKTVIIHDYLNQYGGAERVLESMVEMFPNAPIYTSIYDPEAMPESYRDWDIRTGFMDRLPRIHQHHQWYLGAYPIAFDRLRMPDCDLVLSSSSAFAKIVRPPGGAVHVCYCHSPARFAWTFDQYCERERIPPAVRMALRPMMRGLRRLVNELLADVQVTGDFFLYPEEAIGSINQALDGLSAELDAAGIASAIAAALDPDVDMVGFSPDAIAIAIERGLGRNG